MITNILRLFLLLSNSPGEAAHEMAHRLCEVGVYAAVAPHADDDAADPLAELVATVLCRWEIPGEEWSL